LDGSKSMCLLPIPTRSQIIVSVPAPASHHNSKRITYLSHYTVSLLSWFLLLLLLITHLFHILAILFF